MQTVPAQEQRRFRLREGERVPGGVRRIARGQLDASIERLAGDTDEDPGTAVHETRKSLKRLRATVRLARDELGDEAYRRENVALRDAGRRLGGPATARYCSRRSTRCPTAIPTRRRPRAFGASGGRWSASTAPLSAACTTAPRSSRS
jgi:hypothetical protein